MNESGVNNWYLTNRLHIDACGVIVLDSISLAMQAVTPHESASRHSSRKTARLVVGRLPAYNRSRQFARALFGRDNVEGKANTDNVGAISSTPSKLRLP